MLNYIKKTSSIESQHDKNKLARATFNPILFQRSPQSLSLNEYIISVYLICIAPAALSSLKAQTPSSIFIINSCTAAAEQGGQEAK